MDRRYPEQQRHDRCEGKHHDGVIQCNLRQRESRVAIAQVTPDEHHGRARRRGQQDQPGDVTIELLGRQPACENVADEDPGEQRHREGLDAPVDKQGDTDPSPVLPYFLERLKIDLQEHRQDHQPDQYCDRNIDSGHLHSPQGIEGRRDEAAEQNPGDDAQSDPHAEVALKERHLRADGALAGCFTLDTHKGINAFGGLCALSLGAISHAQAPVGIGLERTGIMQLPVSFGKAVDSPRRQFRVEPKASYRSRE